MATTPSATAENGDVLLQSCSDSIYINEHVVRRIGEELKDVVQPVWAVALLRHEPDWRRDSIPSSGTARG